MDEIEGCLDIAGEGNRNGGVENLDLQCVVFSVHRACAPLEMQGEKLRSVSATRKPMSGVAHPTTRVMNELPYLVKVYLALRGYCRNPRFFIRPAVDR